MQISADFVETNRSPSRSTMELRSPSELHRVPEQGSAERAIIMNPDLSGGEDGPRWRGRLEFQRHRKETTGLPTAVFKLGPRRDSETTQAG
jgi:hypothetical protein